MTIRVHPLEENALDAALTGLDPERKERAVVSNNYKSDIDAFVYRLNAIIAGERDSALLDGDFRFHARVVDIQMDGYVRYEIVIVPSDPHWLREPNTRVHIEEDECATCKGEIRKARELARLYGFARARGYYQPDA